MSSTKKKHEIEDIFYAHTDLSTGYVTRLLEEYAEEVRQEVIDQLITAQAKPTPTFPTYAEYYGPQW